MVKYVRYKRPTLDEGRISFTWVELTNDENVKSMFWEHNMFQWIDMRVTLLRSTEDIINSLIPPEDRDQEGNAPSNYNNYLFLDGVIQTG